MQRLSLCEATVIGTATIEKTSMLASIDCMKFGVGRRAAVALCIDDDNVSGKLYHRIHRWRFWLVTCTMLLSGNLNAQHSSFLLS